MGTFHDDLGELHGITLVVETRSHVYVGRCHEETPEQVILLDAGEYADGEHADSEEKSRKEYLQKAAQFGVWKKHDRIVIPRAEVTRLQRLAEIGH
ncbi:MAG: hypothetical protein V3T77_07475 [Planctomycetota bacterium]